MSQVLSLLGKLSIPGLDRLALTGLVHPFTRPPMAVPQGSLEPLF